MGDRANDCKRTACKEKIPYGFRNYCGKHACKRCEGNKFVEPSYGVKVLCPVCNGSGKGKMYE